MWSRPDSFIYIGGLAFGYMMFLPPSLACDSRLDHIKQYLVAGIVAGRVRRLGSLHGLFAAFVTGCVITAGAIVNFLPYIQERDLFFQVVWQVFTTTANVGALLALPVGLVVSVLASKKFKDSR